MRLTLLYGALFVFSGAVLLSITYLLVANSTGRPVIISGHLTTEPGQPQRFSADGRPELPPAEALVAS